MARYCVIRANRSLCAPATYANDCVGIARETRRNAAIPPPDTTFLANFFLPTRHCRRTHSRKQQPHNALRRKTNPLTTALVPGTMGIVEATTEDATMETKLSYNGTEYTVRNGVVLAGATEITYRGYRPMEPPARFHSALKAKGYDVAAYRLWGERVMPAAVADEAQRQVDAIAAAKRRTLDGLDELEAALAEQERYEAALHAAITSGTQAPRKPAVDVAAVKAQYPVAAAYVLAREWARATHDAKVSAGRRAMQRLESGDAPETVLAEMDAEWTQHATGRQWD